MENRKEGGLRKICNDRIDKTSPLVTIITVVYNAEKTLEDTILSVINQTYNNIEYIIIDGGSTDATIDIIKKYEEHINIWISEPDKGIYDAMNKGISLANGDIIGLLNSDDWYNLSTIEIVVNNMKERENMILHGEASLYDEQKSYIKKMRPNTDFSQINKGMILLHPTFFVSKDVYKRIGCFDALYKVAADYDFTYRALKLGIQFVFIPEVLVNIRLGGISDFYSRLGFRECREISIKKGYGRIKAHIVFLKKNLVKQLLRMRIIK